MDHSTQPSESPGVAARKSLVKLPRNAGLCDGMGVFASLACAMHCAAMPWLVGLLPALGLTWLADAAMHRWLLGVCFVLAFCAFVPDYCQHRRPAAALVGAAGIGLLVWAVFVVPHDHCPMCESNKAGIAPWLTPIGGLLLVVGHMTNRRCCRKHPAHGMARKITAG